MTPGVRLVDGGAEVSVFSRDGERVSVCLFDAKGENEASRHFLTRGSDGWHNGFIAGIVVGSRYGLRVLGPWNPTQGLMFDESKLLIDPYATAFDRSFEYHDQLSIFGIDTAQWVPKCVVEAEMPNVTRPAYRRPEFIYELQVKSFSKLHPQVDEKKRGTVAALANPAIIKHLKALGVDTLELMPIQAWIDERHLVRLGLRNGWGYNTVNLFAPELQLAPGGLQDIRDAVATLHENDFRVVLDVVFNHSGESDELGPTVCYRGLDNRTYYAMTDGVLHNDAGCGNVLDLANPIVVDMVIASMKHWVLKAGVDGFRFDLATVMGRTSTGFSKTAPLLVAIQNDPLLSKIILIAEPWDVGPGGYQLGNFPAGWHEWNDKYRDDVRRFWRGDSFTANALATRLTGSSDVFAGRLPSASVNFLAAHDGFTLHDLVHYRERNNFANGEENRDGNSSEVTWTGGNVKALLACLFLSRGTPMLTAGDEFGRSQNGNNNGYAQDNAFTWLNWQDRDTALENFVRTLTDLRAHLQPFFADAFLGGDEVFWFGENGDAFKWSEPFQRFLGLAVSVKNKRLVVAINGENVVQAMLLPAKPGAGWQRIFTSGNDENCPAQSVSVFTEN
jgi:glycogen operon protein